MATWLNPAWNPSFSSSVEVPEARVWSGRSEGFVDTQDLSLRVPKNSFPGDLPKFGERIEIEGEEYRIVQVSNHPRSPLLTLSLSTTDE